MTIRARLPVGIRTNLGTILISVKLYELSQN